MLYASACPTCSGSGQQTETVPVIENGRFVGTTTRPVQCSSCGGSGLG